MGLSDLVGAHLTAVGLCWILLYGKILNRPRAYLVQFGIFHVLKCSQCLGFWIGVLLWLDPAFRVWWLPLSGSGVCYFADLLMKLVALSTPPMEKPVPDPEIPRLAGNP